MQPWRVTRHSCFGASCHTEGEGERRQIIYLEVVLVEHFVNRSACVSHQRQHGALTYQVPLVQRRGAVSWRKASDLIMIYFTLISGTMI